MAVTGSVHVQRGLPVLTCVVRGRRVEQACAKRRGAADDGAARVWLTAMHPCFDL